MLKKIRKYLVLIPCMIFAFFMFSGARISANEAKLLNASSITIGGSNKSNLYYFSNSDTWQFKVEDIDWVNDAFLKWRVIRPDGSATDWYGSVKGDTRFVDNDGKFTINSRSTLNYNKQVNISDRNSVAPLATYYVDIQYYSHFIWSKHLDKKDETIKIIVGSHGNLSYMPVVDVEYDQASNHFAITASMTDNGKGSGVITRVSYFFSESKVDNVQPTMFKHDLQITPGNTVNVGLPGVDSDYKYLYVLAESGNGYTDDLEFNITTKDIESSDGNKDPETSNKDNESNKDNGSADYEFGEIILIVLVIVLIVSCALIITQKIIDYKKRLY